MTGYAAFTTSLRRSTFVGAFLATAVIAGAAAAHAEGCLNVRTVSGKVSCLVQTGGIYCAAGNAGGFQDAPADAQGDTYLATVTPDGNFQWIRAGGTGSCGNVPYVLEYGVTQNINNWVVQSSQNGTRFTNANSGRGMFVSVENVSWF